MKIFLGAENKYFYSKKIFGRAGHPHAEISATSIFKICGFWPKIDHFLDFLGPVEPENELSTMRNFLVAQNIFSLKKNFSAAPGTQIPKFRPKCFQNWAFLAQNRPFWDFWGLWSPKMSSAP